MDKLERLKEELKLFGSTIDENKNNLGTVDDKLRDIEQFENGLDTIKFPRKKKEEDKDAYEKGKQAFLERHEKFRDAINRFKTIFEDRKERLQESLVRENPIKKGQEGLSKQLFEARVAVAKKEAERKEAEQKAAAERKEAERKEAERKEAERKEAERKAAEKAAANAKTEEIRNKFKSKIAKFNEEETSEGMSKALDEAKKLVSEARKFVSPEILEKWENALLAFPDVIKIKKKEELDEENRTKLYERIPMFAGKLAETKTIEELEREFAQANETLKAAMNIKSKADENELLLDASWITKQKGFLENTYRVRLGELVEEKKKAAEQKALVEGVKKYPIEKKCLETLKSITKEEKEKGIKFYDGEKGAIECIFLNKEGPKILIDKNDMTQYFLSKTGFGGGITTLSKYLGGGSEGQVYLVLDLHDKDCRLVPFIMKRRDYKPTQAVEDDEKIALKKLSLAQNYVDSRGKAIYPHLINEYVPTYCTNVRLDVEEGQYKGYVVSILVMTFTPFIPPMSIYKWHKKEDEWQCDKPKTLMRKGIVDECDKSLGLKKEFTRDEIYTLTVSPWHALDALHMAGYMHNDIKPYNFIFAVKAETEDSDNPILTNFQFIDLGYAKPGKKTLTDERGSISFKTNGYFGSEYYMHPEYFSLVKDWQSKRQTGKSTPEIEHRGAYDQYSLAKSLYEIYDLIQNETVKKICMDMLCYMSNNLYSYFQNLEKSKQAYKRTDEPVRYFDQNFTRSAERQSEERAVLRWLCVKHGFATQKEIGSKYKNMTSEFSAICSSRRGGSYNCTKKAPRRKKSIGQRKTRTKK